MADKSFGVKELNLLNASGTPTITSPNTLNLNATTVAISTNTTVGNNITVTGNITANGNIVGDNSTNISGISSVTATTYYGSGANLTGISAGISTASSNIQATWDVVNNGASAYRFTGPGQDGAEDNPDVYLVRGQRYRFSVNASGHPFQLRVSNGGSAYTDGVTNNGATSGNVEINVQHDAPAQLVYQCTNHGSMVGNIYIVGQHLANGANNRVLTATSAYGINAESNMTFDGDDLTVSHSGLAVNIFESTDNHSRFRIKSGSSSLTQLEFADQDDADAGEIRYDHSSDKMTLHVGNNTERVGITSEGDVGIDRTPTQGDMAGVKPRLHVLGISTSGQFNTVARFESGSDNNDTGAAVVINSTNDRGLLIQGGRGGDADGFHHANSGLGRFSVIHNDGTFHKFMEAWGDNGQNIKNISLFTGNEDEAVRIDTSGNVGIGTDNPTTALEVKGDITVYNANNQGDIFFGEHGDVADSKALIRMDQNSSTAGELQFHTEDNGTLRERVKFQKDGTVIFRGSSVNTTNTEYEFLSSNSSPYLRLNHTANNANHTFIQFRAAGSEVGEIRDDGDGTITYSDSSDYRLKENIVDLTNAITRLKNLKPRRFNFKVAPSYTKDGFLAHELQEVVPEAVQGTKDEIVTETSKANIPSLSDKEVGDPVYQTADVKRVVPLLTAALQEAITEIETLKAKVAALESS